MGRWAVCKKRTRTVFRMGPFRLSPHHAVVPAIAFRDDLTNFGIGKFHFLMKDGGGNTKCAVPENDQLFRAVRRGHPNPAVPGQLVSGFFSMYMSAVSASLVYTMRMF